MDEEKYCLCGESARMHINNEGACLSSDCECDKFEELNSQE